MRKPQQLGELHDATTGNVERISISQMLSTDLAPIHWIADHVGHSSIQMIQQRYGKWIHADGPDIHKAVEKLLGL
ncbi:hypothetical protein ACFO0E_03765 [Chromohalobacter beijerinckii]|uniref:Integrase n=1 Tax=Chromohalobacter beijerinckii TaxID=86179 RepID=A0ABV8XD93_9GAMM|nr:MULTISPECIES: hypothetical protein [Chromohalobacter]MCK0765044.1 hypothetical protein [Chromohalobacter beijerinckii]